MPFVRVGIIAIEVLLMLTGCLNVDEWIAILYNRWPGSYYSYYVLYQPTQKDIKITNFY